MIHETISVEQQENKERGVKAEKPFNTPNKFSHQQRKNTKLSRREQIVYNELLKGKKSVTELTIALGYSDIRSYIRCLRNKGVVVLDEWVENYDTRHKRYFIKSKNHK